VLLLKYPQIATRYAVSTSGTLVHHLIPKGHHGDLTCDIDLEIVLLKFMDSRVVCEIAESGQELSPSLNPPDKTRQDHNDVRVDHRFEVVDAAVEPRLVDSTHCRGGIVSFRFVYHQLLHSHRKCNHEDSKTRRRMRFSDRALP